MLKPWLPESVYFIVTDHLNIKRDQEKYTKNAFKKVQRIYHNKLTPNIP